MSQKSRYKPDFTIYCEQCGVALLYDRETQQWEGQWTPEEHPEVRRCMIRSKIGEATKYNHVPLGNISRLLNTAKKMKGRSNG